MTCRVAVHFSNSDIFGGCEEMILVHLAHLRKEGWDPILFHHGGSGIRRLTREADNLGVVTRMLPRLSRKSFHRGVPQWIRELHRARPAVFHAHLNWPLGCRHALMLARLMRVPAVVATSHLYCPLAGVSRAGLKQRVQAACIDRYIAVSDEVQRRLCSELKIPKTQVCVVRNATRLAAFDRPRDPNLRTFLSRGRDCPIVLTPARLHDQKGHVYLLEAAATVPEAVFVLAGDGPARTSLEARAFELGVADRVRFLGERNDVPELLAACDLFVLPSLYEGLPLAVLEAMAAGRPVVATAIGGTDEAVIDGVTGLLVPPRSATELAAAIRALIAGRAFAETLAAAGRARALAMFSPEAMVRGVVRVYDELLGDAVATGAGRIQQPISS